MKMPTPICCFCGVRHVGAWTGGKDVPPLFDEWCGQCSVTPADYDDYLKRKTDRLLQAEGVQPAPGFT